MIFTIFFFWLIGLIYLFINKDYRSLMTTRKEVVCMFFMAFFEWIFILNDLGDYAEREYHLGERWNKWWDAKL